MALDFGKTKGSAKKSAYEYYTYKNGDNCIRLVGGILPRYVYWVEGFNGKNIPIECLSFDREAEAFTNAEKDWVKEFYPDLKCGWSYSMLCYDPADDKIKVLTLKRKLLEQIMTAAEDLGDPTDPETGWDVNFKRVKTGPMAFNVEYQLQALKCKPSALSDEVKELIASSPTIDEVIPRQTADDQKALIEKIQSTDDDDADADGADEEVESEFDLD